MYDIISARNASIAICVRTSLSALVFTICLLAAQSVSAATYTVSTNLDSGPGSLRQAVLDANASASSDTIVFAIPIVDCPSVVCTIAVGPEMTIANNGSLTILGTGSNRLTIDGGGSDRIFYSNGATFTVSGVTLTGGDGIGASPAANGGAIFVNGGTTVIRNVYFTSNVVSASGGAVFYNGGANHRIENSTFNANTAFGNFARGGAIVLENNASMTVLNSTFAGNSAPNGGAGAIGLTSGSMTMRGCTVVYNTASNLLGGGGLITQGAFVFSNSIVAINSTPGGSTPEFRFNGGSITSEGYNLVGDAAGDAANTSGAIPYLPTDILDTPPLLDALLADYGGTVPTMRPQAGSPVIDKGNSTLGLSPTLDARGVIRPFDDLTIVNASRGTAKGGKGGFEDSIFLGVVANGADIGAVERIPNYALGWGSNLNGNAGDGVTSAPRLLPVQMVGGFADIVSMEGGNFASLGLRSGGTVLSWGRNAALELGRTTSNATEQATPTLIPGLTGVVATGGGYEQSFAILAGGTVEAWGSDISGQLGDGTAGGVRSTRLTVKTDAAGTIPLTGVIAVSGGLAHSIALRSDGTVWTWGDDTNGQLGDGAGNSTRAFAQQVPGLANVMAIDAGFNHNLALLADGTVRAWGLNGNGQLGDTTVTTRFAPVQPAITGVTQIAAGSSHSVALKADGSVSTWGNNAFAQLGNGTSGGPLVLAPTQIGTITQVTDIKSTLGSTTYARRRSGAIFAWGLNVDGEIGNGTVTPGGCQCQPTPVQTSVAAGTAVFGAFGLGGVAALPIAQVFVGANQFVRLGDATVSIADVNQPGEMQIRTFDPMTTGLTVPAGYTIEVNSNGYDITSSAQFPGNAQVCLKTQNVIDQNAFDRLTILHDDNFDGVFDVASVSKNYQTREVCRVTQSFSPFVLAQALAPTAAHVSVSGRVMVDGERGLANAVVYLSDESGTTHMARTGSFGYYRFDDIEVGQTYIVTVTSKRYQFAAQIVSVNDEMTELNFVAGK